MKYNHIIKFILQDKNISQAQMAKILGVNQTTVSQWILGKKKPSFDNIFSIYKNFGVTPNELFDI